MTNLCPGGLHKRRLRRISPATAQAMNTNLRAVNCSPKHTTLPRKANRLANDANMVFEVTLVIDREALNDHCAENHRGATCRCSRRETLMWVCQQPIDCAGVYTGEGSS